MPFGSESEEERIGLALSGGGFRAMLFHAGALWRLNELGLLVRLDRISSVSGGSLVSGRLAVSWSALDFEDGVATNFREEVIKPVLRFSTRLIDVPSVLTGFLPFASAAGTVTSFYRRHLVDRATLQDLPERPRFVFNATHLSSGVGWRFSKPYMGCYRLGLVREPGIEVATAMAASAAFPPFLSPLILSLDPNAFEETDGADLYSRRELRAKVALSDGGVYDNLGLETVVKRCHTILASDAGGGLDVKPGSFRFWPAQVRRVIDTTTEQARALRRRALVGEFTAGRKEGTIWRTGTNINEYPTRSPFSVHPDWRFHLAAIRTRLNPFTEEERGHLVNWGYLLADVAVRSYLLKNATPPPELPFPAFDFSAAPPSGRSGVGGEVS